MKTTLLSLMMKIMTRSANSHHRWLINWLVWIPNLLEISYMTQNITKKGAIRNLTRNEINHPHHQLYHLKVNVNQSREKHDLKLKQPIFLRVLQERQGRRLVKKQLKRMN